MRCAIVDTESVAIRTRPLSNASVPSPHVNTFTQLARPLERRERAIAWRRSVRRRGADPEEDEDGMRINCR